MMPSFVILFFSPNTMINNTFLDYVTIRLSIFGLRLVAPASIAYLLSAALKPEWWYLPLGVVAAAEASFYLFVYLPRTWTPQAVPLFILSTGTKLTFSPLAAHPSPTCAHQSPASTHICQMHRSRPHPAPASTPTLPHRLVPPPKLHTHAGRHHRLALMYLVLLLPRGARVGWGARLRRGAAGVCWGD